MVRNWTQTLAEWLKQRESRKPRRRVGGQRRVDGSRYGAMIGHVDGIEPLESRQMLTNLVAVSVSGQTIHLNDASRGKVSTGDNFSVSYTGTQVVLTGQNGTSFKVGGQTLSTYTVNISSPSINMNLNANANSVTVTGDGTSSLNNLSVNLGSGKQNNSLTLTKVTANSVTVNGGRHNDSVTLNQSTVNGNLYANLGSSSGDLLDLESSTVKGNVRDWVSTLTMNQSTITGKLNDVESASNSTINSTDSTYTGAVSINMGRDGSINMLSSTAGTNHFHSLVSITGVRHHDITTYQHPNSVIYDAGQKLKHASGKTVGTTVGTPTVNSLKTTSTTPTITGTYDSVKAPNLTVAVNGTTYTLGTSSQLTSPSAGNWSLNLTGAPLPSGSTTATVTNSDGKGDSAQGTGTVTVTTITAPTVTSLNEVINTPTISGTYDSVNGPKLTVAANGTTYTLGTSSQLTSPSTGKWSLNLTGAPLPSGSTTVTVTSSNSDGTSVQRTGTVTTNAQTVSELPTIHTYETNNNLTATQTNSGLNYVTKTQGTGAIPTAGQTLTVNYSGFLLNSNGTKGTEFDSNVDAKFGHVSPFTFKLGQGQVIAGWDEAFALLPVGTVAQLIIPSAIAYGTSGSGSSIPPNSILIFDVTLVSAV